MANAAFEAVSAPEQYCFALLSKVEHSVSDGFLKRSKSSLNTFIGAEIATEPRIGELSLNKPKGRVANCMTGKASVHSGNLRNNFCTVTELVYALYRSNF